MPKSVAFAPVYLSKGISRQIGMTNTMDKLYLLLRRLERWNITHNTKHRSLTAKEVKRLAVLQNILK